MNRTVFDISLSPRVRKSPFIERTFDHGLVALTVYNHMMLPAHYGDHLAEYHNLMNNCCLWDVSAERQIELIGPDAAKLAQLLCPRDLSNCQDGQGLYVPIVNHDGGMLNDPVLLKHSDEKFWLSIADGDLLLWASAVAGERGFDVKVHEPDVSPLAIQGPKAMELGAELFGDWVRTLKYFWFRETDLNGIPVVVARSGWSKQGGIEVYLLDGRRGNELWDRIWSVGEKHDIAIGCPNQYERIESGLLSYGSDMTIENNPYEVGLGRFVTPDADVDFIGKAALQRIRDEGPKLRQIGLFVDGTPLPYNTEALTVTIGRQVVGKVTALIHSPKLERNIAIALLDSEVVESGESVLVQTEYGPRYGVQTTIPFMG